MKERNLVDQIASLRAVTVFEKLGLKIPVNSNQRRFEIASKYISHFYTKWNCGRGRCLRRSDLWSLRMKRTSRSIEGIQEQDPVFGLPVLWITQELQEEVGGLFVQVMDPVSVIITHLSKVVEKHALMSCSLEMKRFPWCRNCGATSPRLVDGVIGKTVSLSRFHRILKALLEEKVSVKDMPLIIETVVRLSKFVH